MAYYALLSSNTKTKAKTSDLLGSGVIGKKYKTIALQYFMVYNVFAYLLKDSSFIL